MRYEVIINNTFMCAKLSLKISECTLETWGSQFDVVQYFFFDCRNRIVRIYEVGIVSKITHWPEIVC